MIFRLKKAILLTGLIVLMSSPVLSYANDHEYQVVILKGITAGGTIEKLSSGIYVDTKKTEALNTLAFEGWEVIGVVGAPGADHTVYLKRRAR